MNTFAKILLIVTLLFPLTVQAQKPHKPTREERQAAKQLARAEKEQAEQLAYQQKHAPKETDVVYLFGVGTNFNDSTVYLTEVQPVNYMRLTKKYKFLPYRADFSQQLKDYLVGKYEMQYETTCVFYDVNRKKLAKRFYKMKKRYLDMGTSNMVIVSMNDFKFEKPEYENLLF
ncbi:MAG: hypothetical protein K5778_07155 [Bacteroidaceae bacterium]|nr:hypothetical protein [Bacteroidaceae bacterium]MDO4994582.1 hypothetical protein [Bacteroidales bacterium]